MSDDDLDALNAFVNSLTMANGYPCSRRRMKKYVSEVGVDNFTRWIFQTEMIMKLLNGLLNYFQSITKLLSPSLLKGNTKNTAIKLGRIDCCRVRHLSSTWKLTKLMLLSHANIGKPLVLIRYSLYQTTVSLFNLFKGATEAIADFVGKIWRHFGISWYEVKGVCGRC